MTTTAERTENNVRILLIRHGQTDWNLAGKMQGLADIPLNATGLAQADALARRLAAWPIDAIYSSDLKRAFGTAEQVAAAVGISAEPEPLWRERDMGKFAGMTHDALEALYPNRNDRYAQPDGGERPQQVLDRALAGYEKILGRHTSGTVAIFSHGSIIAVFIAHLLGIPIDQNRRFSVGSNTGISIIDVKNGVTRLHSLNDSAHLE